MEAVAISEFHNYFWQTYCCGVILYLVLMPFRESLVRMKYTHMSLCSIRTAYLRIKMCSSQGNRTYYRDGGAWWGCGLWGCKESDTTKQLTHTIYICIDRYRYRQQDYLLACLLACLLSPFGLFVTPWTTAHQVPPSIEFP